MKVSEYPLWGKPLPAALALTIYETACKRMEGAQSNMHPTGLAEQNIFSVNCKYFLTHNF